MNLPITLVTICLNQVDFVAQTIKSVLGQGYQPLQYIVVDGGSTDGSREKIIENTDPSVELIFEPDRGPPDALNRGLAKARGEVFVPK